VLVTSSARAAEEAAPFGEPGQLVIRGGSQLLIEHQESTGVQVAGTIATPDVLSLSASVDAFVARHFSVGFRGGSTHDFGSDAFNYISLGPTIGYDVPLGGSLSLWPTVTLHYGYSWYGQGSHGQSIELTGYLPLLYHPAPHFFVGWGPFVAREVFARSSSPGTPTMSEPLLFQYGAQLTVGGWLAL
jgi:hypothetical protein